MAPTSPARTDRPDPGARGALKVAVLAHSFPRFPGDTHGPFVKHLSEALARRGHEVHVLVPWDTELGSDPDTPLAIHSFRYVYPERFHLLGYSRTLEKDVRLKLQMALLSPLYFAFAERALARLVRDEGIELVHAHWLLPNGFVAARVAARARIPYAVTLHGSDIFMAERNPLFRALARRAASGAAHITACSADLRDRLLAIGGPAPDRVLLVANGTEVLARPLDAAAAAFRRRLGIDAAAPLVVAVGRMVYKKGFRYLLEAMTTVLEAAPEAHLAIGGGGDLFAELEALAGALGVAGRVHFTGVLAHDEVLALVSASDVFVMPSVRDPKGNIDGLPIVVLEAMAAARPVVATAVAGMPLAVDDRRTGVLVPEKDPAALARALIELLADRGRARRMGEAGAARVRDELSWDVIAGRHDELYRAAAARRG